MLKNLTTFRTDILQIESFDSINDMVEDCCRKCHELTYSNVFQECEEYQIRCSMSESMDDSDNDRGWTNTDGGENCEQSTSLEFWERFLRCILTLVEEDLVYFGPIFQSVLPEFDLAYCSAEKNWEMLLADLVGFLEHEDECRHWASISDYMKLQVTHYFMSHRAIFLK